MPRRRRPRSRRRTTATRWPWTALLFVVLLAAIVHRTLSAAQPLHPRAAHAAAYPQRTLPPRPEPATSELRPSARPAATNTPAATVSAAPLPIPSRAAGSPARLAIIIDDCGQWPAVERALVALPYRLTFSILPHMRFSADLAERASAAGQSVMLHLPMENESGIDPGPGAITTDMSDDAIRTQVRSDLRFVPGAAGVNNHEGSRATADARVMNAVSDVLAQEHRFFIDSRTSAASIALQTASARGVPTARRVVFLDDVDRFEDVVAQLERAADIARERGTAIAIGHPRARTLAAIAHVAERLSASGIEFVAAGDVVQ